MKYKANELTEKQLVNGVCPFEMHTTEIKDGQLP